MSPSDRVRSVGSGPLQPDNDVVLGGHLGLAAKASDQPFDREAGWHVLYEQVRPKDTIPGFERGEDRRESGLIEGHERVRVKEPDRFPFSTVCALRMRDERGLLWGGTGTLVGRRLVLTAGHNVFDRDKNPRRGWFENIHVIPGLNGNLAVTPFPTAQSTAFRSTDLWTEHGADEWDIGAVLLPSPLGDYAGWMATAKLTIGTLTGLAVHIPGYPIDCPGTPAQCGPPATTMWMGDGNILHVEQQFVRYNIDTTIGESGAPAIAVFADGPEDDRYRLVAVHTEGYDWRSNRGVRISDDVLAVLQGWLTESAAS